MFSIEPNELKEILQSSSVVNSPVTALSDGHFVRTVDTGKIIGTTKLNDGGVFISVITVITDKAGNLIITYLLRLLIDEISSCACVA